MANFDFKGYDNIVIEDIVSSYLNTKLGMSRFLTVDNSLVNVDGLKVDVHKYTGSGNAEDLDRGEGNENDIDAQFEVNEYVASRHQARTRYYDDDAFTDSTWVDAKLQYLAEAMTNDYNNKAIAEMAKTENVSASSSFDFDAFCDAVAKFANEYESEAGLMFLANQKLVPALRKTLNTNLMPTEGYIRTGAIGAILNIPVYTSKIVPEGIIFCVSKEAVKDFVKSGLRIEQERDKNTKENIVYSDRYDVIALVDESKCIMMGKGQATDATITTATAGAATIAGAATTGAKVQAYVNGKASGVAVTASSNAYSITAEANLVAGDVVKVVAELNGFVKSIATAVVA